MPGEPDAEPITAMRAEGGSAFVLHPFLDIADRERFLTEQEATNVAALQLCHLISGMAVSGVQRLMRERIDAVFTSAPTCQAHSTARGAVRSTLWPPAHRSAFANAAANTLNVMP